MSDSAGQPTILATINEDAGEFLQTLSLRAKPAIFGELHSEIHPRLAARLKHLGFHQLYSHQAHSVDASLRGEDVVVVTGTNSGKSLCYVLPALHAALSEPAARGLFLFPTKALAQDQARKLQGLLPGPDVRVGTYDGDTPRSQRSGLRKMGHILLSNPDMLHVGILPQHESWVPFLKNLRVIAVDEMHTYRGVFGSHVGNVLRRLLRLCEWHGNRPRVVACSATIANPTELFKGLTGRVPTLIDEDGSPQAERTYSFYTPPMLDEQTRGSANMATASIVAGLAEQGLRTLAFCRSRVSTELVLRYTRDRLDRVGKLPPAAVESYRAGYTPRERRAIEKALFQGDLMALVATNAMELGVDVGDLDAVVMNGYPGTISSFWQQSGRAGRGSRPGLSILVAHDDPLEQWLIREPERVMDGRVEGVAIHPTNRFVLDAQLRCAAQERPMSPSDLTQFGGQVALELAEEMEMAGELTYQGGLFYYPHHESAAMRVSIRGVGEGTIRLMVGLEEIGTMELWRALQSAHAGAVYLQRGQTYFVEELDLESKVARLRPEVLPYYTQCLDQSLIEQTALAASLAAGEHRGAHVGVRVTEQVLGFKQKSLDGERVLGVFDLDLPPQSFETTAFRLDFDREMGTEEDESFLCALHGLEHALLAVAPIFGGCDRGDLGSGWFGVSPDTLRPALFVFDRAPGGVGIAEKLYAAFPAWRDAACRLLLSCPCALGCPGCLLSSRCEVNNELLDKRLTLKLLESLH